MGERFSINQLTDVVSVTGNPNEKALVDTLLTDYGPTAIPPSHPSGPAEIDFGFLMKNLISLVRLRKPSISYTELLNLQNKNHCCILLIIGRLSDRKSVV